VTFLNSVVCYEYSYLLTYRSVFVDNYLWQFYGIMLPNDMVGKFLLQDLECYKDTRERPITGQQLC